ncbi:MAG TPA: thiamine phosphate synthase [Terriglobales bacterium]|nr:thiamine phosphate synthase [Terriglobales bacterium]
MKNFDLTLYLCTDRHWLGNMTLADAVERAIDGGATLVQLREKDISTLDFLESARTVQTVCRRHGVPLIINDRIDIALAIDAEGVHVGQDDMPCAIARRILGEDKVIGVSVHTLEEAKRAIEDGADYIGIGAVFMTSTKQVSRAMTKDEVLNILENADIPACAIGGIDEETGPGLAGLGLDGIAVISSILSRPDITEAARRMRDVAEMIIG